MDSKARYGTDPPALCPSAQPDWEGAVAIGVVGGTPDEPRLRHLDRARPATPELLALAQPVTPAEVFRFAAPCRCDGCVHFTAEQCRLAERVVKVLIPVVAKPPACPIRPSCRWWQQEGGAACLRCPQVVTDNYHPSGAMVEAAGADAAVAIQRIPD
jgi:hypothetical protein